jgi:lipid-A-disaccharide synthase
MFIAGENSGDQHAARLIRELRTLLPHMQCFGFGGEQMEAAGMRLEQNLAQKLPIIGLSQAVRNYGKLKALLRRVGDMLANEKPDALILVDYPGFNLRVARIAKQLGIPVIYFISPQIWAWHKSRLQAIAETVSLMLVILPFEEDLYRKAGVPVAYVGHPLQDDTSPIRPREEVLTGLGVKPGSRVIGVIPGSRRGEVVRHMPVLMEAVQLLAARLPDAEFVMPRASTIPVGMIDKYLQRYPGARIHVAEHDLKSVRAAMDFAICKSGTSTLELALLGVPMVIIYKVSLPTLLLAKAVLRIPWIGLVNIVANQLVAPELVQRNATPGKIAAAVEQILGDPAALSRMRDQLAKVRAKFSGAGASRRAATEIARLLGELKPSGKQP